MHIFFAKYALHNCKIESHFLYKFAMENLHFDEHISKNILQFVDELNARAVCKQWRDLYILPDICCEILFEKNLEQEDFEQADKYIDFANDSRIKKCFVGACCDGKINILKWIDEKIDRPIQIEFMDAISWAVKMKHYDVVKYLVGELYEKNLRKRNYGDKYIACTVNFAENNCLYNACQHGDCNLAKLFIDKRTTNFWCGLNISPRFALVGTCVSGNIEFITLILTSQKQYFEQNHRSFIHIIMEGIASKQYAACRFALTFVDFSLNGNEIIELISMARTNCSYEFISWLKEEYFQNRQTKVE